MSENLPAAQGQMNLAVAASLNINMADVVTVAVSEAETKIRESLKVSDIKIKDLRKSADDIRKQITEEIESTISTRFADQIKVVEEFLALFGNTSMELYGCLEKLKEDENSLQIAVSIKNIRYSDEKHMIPATESLIALKSQLKAVEEDIEKTAIESADWRRKLGNIPSLERLYRGKFVRAQMESSVEGQQILTSLVGDLDSVINRM